MSSDGGIDGGSGGVGNFSSARKAVVVILHDVVRTLVVVSIVGLLLFAASGVWPPLVAVESGSMEPQMNKGDMVFISEPGRYAPGNTDVQSDVISAETGRENGYRSLGGFGSVIVYSPPESSESRVIHRASFWVSEGENWFDRANPKFVSADDCAELRNCPAPNAGFVTKGDANSRYDQAAGISPPVHSESVLGAAHVRIPYLGWVRLFLGL